MKKQIKISDLCSQLHSSYYAELDIEEKTGLQPSPQRIKEIAYKKLKQQQHQPIKANIKSVRDTDSRALEKRRFMRRKTVRITFVAAIICFTSIALGAAFGGLDYFKTIFGKEAASIQEDIQTPLIFAKNDDYKIIAESILSDGYKTNIIVSLESLKGETINREASNLFTVRLKDKDTDQISAYSYERIDTFNQVNKNFYRIEVSTLDAHLSSTIEIALKEQQEDLEIEIPIEHAAAGKEFLINAQKDENNNYRPERVLLSPLGVLVIGSENKAKGGLPTCEINLLMKDGTMDELISSGSFDSEEDDSLVVSGGGGIVLVGKWQKEPLVIQTMGVRNPENKVVTTGHFSRILNLNQVEAIIVDGVEYR